MKNKESTSAEFVLLPQGCPEAGPWAQTLLPVSPLLRVRVRAEQKAQVSPGAAKEQRPCHCTPVICMTIRVPVRCSEASTVKERPGKSGKHMQLLQGFISYVKSSLTLINIKIKQGGKKLKSPFKNS